MGEIVSLSQRNISHPALTIFIRPSISGISNGGLVQTARSGQSRTIYREWMHLIRKPWQASYCLNTTKKLCTQSQLMTIWKEGRPRDLPKRKLTFHHVSNPAGGAIVCTSVVRQSCCLCPASENPGQSCSVHKSQNTIALFTEYLTCHLVTHPPMSLYNGCNCGKLSVNLVPY